MALEDASAAPPNQLAHENTCNGGPASHDQVSDGVLCNYTVHFAGNSSVWSKKLPVTVNHQHIRLSAPASIHCPAHGFIKVLRISVLSRIDKDTVR